MSPSESARCGSWSTSDEYANRSNVPNSVGSFSAISRVTSFSRRRRYSIRSAIVHIFSACLSQNPRRSGSRAMLPSSFRISQITATSRNPASRHRSTLPSV